MSHSVFYSEFNLTRAFLFRQKNFPTAGTLRTAFTDYWTVKQIFEFIWFLFPIPLFINFLLGPFLLLQLSDPLTDDTIALPLAS